MRISDWSSDVCSSDLVAALDHGVDCGDQALAGGQRQHRRVVVQPEAARGLRRQRGEVALDQLELAGAPALAGGTQRALPCLAQLGEIGRPAEFLGSRSEEHTSELQSLMRISYAVFCLKKKTLTTSTSNTHSY